MKDGFTNTLLNILKNSMIIGTFIVTMTVLAGMLKHTSGAKHIFVIALMSVVLLLAIKYVKKEFSRRW